MKRVVSFLVVCALAILSFGATPASAIIRTWRKILPDSTLTVAVTPSPVAGAPSILLAGTAVAIKKSTDNGASWATVFTGASSSLAVDPSNPAVVYAATGGGLRRSTDYGDTWAVLDTATKFSVAVSPFNPLVIYGDNRKSVDGGTTWTVMTYSVAPPLGSGLPIALPVSSGFHIKCSKDPAYPGFLLASMNERSYRSDDGGVTWKSFQSDVDSVEIDPVDARYYYLGGRCGRSITRFFPNPSGTGSLSGSNGPSHIHGIVVDPTNHARVFAVGDYGGASASSDYGQTWQQVGSAGSGEVPNGKIAFDPASGQVLLPTPGGLSALSSWCTDADKDGYSPDGDLCGPVDCADADPTRNPAVIENCLDGIDNNCDGKTDMVDGYCIQLCSDVDRDGHTALGCPSGDDCDDYEATIHPGARELCDGWDNNCNGEWDEGFDQDADGYTSCGGDCNDKNLKINPGAPETPNDRIDQNCDGYDLSVAFSNLSYRQDLGKLVVEATSRYGANAALEASAYGPLTWDRRKGNWSATFLGLTERPSFVKVCGPEGCRDYLFQHVEAEYSWYRKTLEVEYVSKYGEFDYPSLSIIGPYPNWSWGWLTWNAATGRWEGTVTDIPEKPVLVNLCENDGCLDFYDIETR